MNHTILGRLLVFGRQELIEHAVEGGEFADLVVADQIDTVKAGGEGFETAQIAVIAEEVVQKTRGKTAALRTAAGGDASDGGKESVGMEPAFGNDFFDAGCFFAEDQRVLDLLRIHPRRIFGEQRNGFIRSDDMRQNAFALQQTGPDVEAVFSVAIFRRRVFAAAGPHQGGGVFGNIERLLQMRIVNGFPVSEFAQKI